MLNEKKFRFWCQTVLPLVYDDSLSYYELLNKVVDYLNATMEDVDTMHEDVTNLFEAYDELQGYVNSYFDNLDVQNEIDNKLDSMAANGRLSTLLSPYIPNLVEEWLDTHITATTPLVDNSLSVSGAAADAKVTGDRLNELDNAVYNITKLTFEQGVIDSGTITYGSNKFVRSDSAIKVKAGDTLIFNKQPRQYVMVVYYYNSTTYNSYMSYKEDWVVNANTDSELVISRDGYIRLRVTTGANVDITASEINGLNIVDLYADNVTSIIVPHFVQGAISGGADAESPKYCRTPDYIFMPKGSKVIFGGLDFQITINVYYYYTPNASSYVGYASSDVSANPSIVNSVTIPEDCYIRLRVNRGNMADITPTDVEGWNAIKYRINVGNAVKSDIKVESFNTTYLTEDVDWETPLSNYTALINNASHADAFMFFTDPHIMGSNGLFPVLMVAKYIGYLQKIYNNTPCNFVVGGGDWLNSGDTVAQAKMKLGYISGMMSSLFGDDYKPIVGNHDTNYIGSDTIDYQTMTNLWYGKTGKNYYKFTTPSANYYVLDTWHENQTTMNDYRWEQIDWLASDLIENDSPRSALMFHIFYSAGAGTTTNTFADVIGEIISAYNAHTVVETYGRTYDFTGTTGKIYFVCVGHSHSDFTATIGGVPCIGTINMQAGNIPTFDLVYVDYDNRKYKTIRIGTGSNRTIDI